MKNNIDDLKNNLHKNINILNSTIYYNSNIKTEEFNLLNNTKINYNLKLINLFNNSSSYNNLIKLQNDPIIKKNIIINGSTPEDARIIIINNKLKLLYNRCIDKPNKLNNRLMHLFDIESNKEIIIGENISDIFEKNWGLFIINNDQYVIYSIIPFKVYKLNKENLGEECKSKKYYNIFKVFKEKYKDYKLYIRNSSKAIFYIRSYCYRIR